MFAVQTVMYWLDFAVISKGDVCILYTYFKYINWVIKIIQQAYMFYYYIESFFSIDYLMHVSKFQ